MAIQDHRGHKVLKGSCFLFPKSVQLGVSISNKRGTAAPGRGRPRQIWPDFENIGVPVVSRWCPGGVPVVSRWCPGGVPVVSRWCPGGVPVSWCPNGPDGAPMTSQQIPDKCPDDIPMVCPDGVPMKSQQIPDKYPDDIPMVSF